ncbi:thiopeptide-type bacteriocin biosynthesis protein [Streptomyces marincola]|uniref:Methyltransferase n=1 Tax=Streptomyces marincola TaxID=2878388 RepID=A0A1W7D0T7_9ACTN|nr:thiopeptide-type bacteriocin biosynthesis protein [Streptomyces marincola]ARQ70644.1 methyltransferase [Streptomyces marincola]
MPQPTWRQVNVEFPHWEHAETTAVKHIAPFLRAAEAVGTITAWFIIRKRPCWRVRYTPVAGAPNALDQHLDELVAAGHATVWAEIIYEPEVHAFGGAQSMDSAHRFFHRDSRALLEFLGSGAVRHRRETSLMLCSLMMRAAGLDWYEQGDVWARVAAHRAPPPDSGQHHGDRLHTAVHRLLSVDSQYAVQPGGPLAEHTDWGAAYTDAGEDLAHLNGTGQLRRGLRDVLAHHVIFAWNRLGLSYTAQATLTAAAKTMTFGSDPSAEKNPASTAGARSRDA